ncbi:MAG: hypothetical protein A2293_14775 [Elusimicrobia bacterium RIFOXYB2_FULL_49_7]|nr:MAG: hypothetical protein A2293_14775 [Elusimicrobia bacterium RIFOXYB2_FULL_49_7]
MVGRIIASVFKKFGFDIVRSSSARVPVEEVSSKHGDSSAFVLYKYLKEDGSFNYERYKKIQTEGNRRKINQVWVVEENIQFLSNYIKKTLIPRFGLCHGTRRGKEQEWFGKYLGCNVIGTEISDTATEFPNTIQWDFHQVKPEWLDAVDFIYSNSFDHSFDPENCIRNWMRCLTSDGLCIIEHSDGHEASGASALDPFGAQSYLMPYLFATWSKGDFYLKEILIAPQIHSKAERIVYFVLQRIK